MVSRSRTSVDDAGDADGLPARPSKESCCSCCSCCDEDRFDGGACRRKCNGGPPSPSRGMKRSSSPASFSQLVRSGNGICFALLLAFTTYGSEAFASSHYSKFIGKRLSTAPFVTSGRGGSQASPQHPGGCSSRGGSTVAPMRCVMQIPGVQGKVNGYSGEGPERDPLDQTEELYLPERNGKHEPERSTSSSQEQPEEGLSGSFAEIPKEGEPRRFGIAGLASIPTPETSYDPSLAEYVAETKLPTDVGQFMLRAYRVPGAPMGQEPCVIYCRDKPPFGDDSTNPARNVPVRVHDQCLTSEVFRSQRCDCKEQLQMALKYIKKNGGFIIYLQQEGRGIGLANKVAAYALQDFGLDTVDANLHLGFPEDLREYGVVKSILSDMNVASIRLMTNNPRKVERLEKLGINVEDTIPVVVPKANKYNRKYLETKVDRMSHANLAPLLARKNLVNNNVVGSEQLVNGAMAPRKHLAEQYINNGTEFTANAVQVSLMIDAEDAIAAQTESEELLHQETLPKKDASLGVKAAADGYCFGRQSVLDAIDSVARGEMVVVVDDMDRENEGDLIMAADQCTALDMAKIIRYSSGVVCVGMEGKRMDELKLPAMVSNNEDPKGTAFSITVDATKEHGITTGISASDRATTVRMLASPESRASDFHRPGHLFPLRAKDGGVLSRDGHTEAAVDLSRLAGLSPVGVLCEIVSEENPTEMMRLPELRRFCKKHGFVMTSIVDIAQYRRETNQ